MLAVAFIAFTLFTFVGDPIATMLGQEFSVAQRDAPLSRFDHVPDVVAKSHEILELRSRAMPKFPQQPQ